MRRVIRQLAAQLRLGDIDPQSVVGTGVAVGEVRPGAARDAGRLSRLGTPGA